MTRQGVILIFLGIILSMVSFSSSIEIPLNQAENTLYTHSIEVTNKEQIRAEMKENVEERFLEIKEEVLEEEERRKRELAKLRELGGKMEKEWVFERENKEVKLRIEERIENDEVKRFLKTRLETGEEIKIKTKLRIDETNVDDRKKLRAELSNGERKEIKLLPDKASMIARERFKTKNMTVELIEVGKGSEANLRYQVLARKKAKFLWIKTHVELTGKIDPETGEVIDYKKPWWAFLVTGEDESQLEE